MMLLHALQTNNSYLFQVAALFHIGTTKSHPPIPEHLTAEAKDFLLKCLQKYIHDFVVSWFPSFPHYFFGWKEPITYTHTHTCTYACLHIYNDKKCHALIPHGAQGLMKNPRCMPCIWGKTGCFNVKNTQKQSLIFSCICSHTHTQCLPRFSAIYPFSSLNLLCCIVVWQGTKLEACCFRIAAGNSEFYVIFPY